MNDMKFASRWLAALIIAELVLGPFTNFALLDPVFQGEGGFLANAAPNAPRCPRRLSCRSRSR